MYILFHSFLYVSMFYIWYTDLVLLNVAIPDSFPFVSG